MKKIINCVKYDTNTAEKIASYWNGLGGSNFHYQTETIYKTKNGRYFLHGVGGAASKYATVNYGWSSSGETIIPLTPDEVYQYLEDWDKIELIETMFPEKIKEA